jgi:hypothetical protein
MPERQEESHPLCRWLLSLPGGELVAAERALITFLAAGIVGGHAVQIGLNNADLMDETRAVSRHILWEEGSDQLAGACRTSRVDLPLADESVRLLICHHAHELNDDAEQMMSEISRVLSPKGVALIFAFNSRVLPTMGYAPESNVREHLHRKGPGALMRMLKRQNLVPAACLPVLPKGHWLERTTQRMAVLNSVAARMANAYVVAASKLDRHIPIFNRRNLKRQSLNGQVSGSTAGVNRL